MGGAVSNGQILRICGRTLCGEGEETRSRNGSDVAALGAGKNVSALSLS